MRAYEDMYTLIKIKGVSALRGLGGAQSALVQMAVITRTYTGGVRLPTIAASQPNWRPERDKHQERIWKRRVC